MSNNHLIGKQVIQVEVNAAEDTYVLQQKLSELVWKNLAPELSDLFDRYAGEEQVLQLDKVEIDLGKINLKGLDDDTITREILQLLEAELKQHTVEINSKNNENSQGFAKPKLGQSTTNYMFQLWLFWLERGVLPVYALKPENNWISQVLETLATEHRAISRLKETLLKSENALQRLILQHSEKDLKSIVELYTGFSQNQLLVFKEELRKFLKKESKSLSVLKINFRELEIKNWELVLRKVILQAKKSNSEVLQRAILQELPDKLFRQLKEIAETKPGMYSYMNEAIGRISEKNKASHLDIGEENILEITAAGSNQIQAEFDEIKRTQFITNAGLVLLHPFLIRLFQKLEFLEENNFKNFHCQSKAVLLLQFLATGNDVMPEYEMQLPKFLCGMPAKLPIYHLIRLSRTEKEESNHLLKAVIENWGALGTTSPEGLQEGFLVRDGKLMKNDSGWKLIVEAKTIDILLDKLPWGISIIKLPWMEEHLKIAWR
ncbi:contractile injection system tape measure protein [Autumnicola psychrophila]|uniref:Contractile injection system tape measure protein n=1 Tax=Autumnicola psychrophila TaxID=3075592 RepID=A0ABU3DTJ4_9FLAO|nr:contractile injection system tape measure protein [Zunongwangia sp. F225]MDT0687010.1 contractile injection system tape measure protein [Zunongwangia sp. F225]